MRKEGIRIYRAHLEHGFLVVIYSFLSQEVNGNVLSRRGKVQGARQKG